VWLEQRVEVEDFLPDGALGGGFDFGFGAGVESGLDVFCG
jgi:hypothetical protein